MATDQGPPIISAVEQVLLTSTQIFDDYHHNNNQLKNCLALNNSLSVRVDVEDVMQRLLDLRQSATVDVFLKRRQEFKSNVLATFSGNGAVAVNGKCRPRWYHALFYTYKERVVNCNGRYNGGLRFLFQGSRYTESSMLQYPVGSTTALGTVLSGLRW